MDDLKNRLGLDAQSQKVDWGTLGVLGSESIAKLKYVITLDDVIKFFYLMYVYFSVSIYACMYVCMHNTCIFARVYVYRSFEVRQYRTNSIYIFSLA